MPERNELGSVSKKYSDQYAQHDSAGGLNAGIALGVLIIVGTLGYLFVCEQLELY